MYVNNCLIDTIARRIIVILQIIIALPVFGQNQNNVWYFGENAGITFSTNPPTALTNGQLNTFEGCASICDNGGNLLFYTDGMTIYNKNHVVMNNGSGLNGDFSSTQSAVIVPLPGSSTIYYVFSLDAFAGAGGVCYSIVDMTLAGGLGAVTIKNQLILNPASEKITVVKHANNQDFWIVVHGWSNNLFYAYEFSSAGLNMTPVTTAIGSVHTGGGGVNSAANAIGYMKVNPASNVIALAICIQDVYEIFQFNNSTGILSNMVSIPDPDNSSTALAYGMEFSPDNHYLYIKNFYSYNVYQYDMSVYNQASIVGSKTLVGTVSGASIYFTGAMQLGPDNKIYIVEYDTPFLSVINNPNNSAATCGLVDNAISLNGRNGQLGLPCLVNSTFFNNSVSVSYNGCFNSIYHFYLSDSTSITGVAWNFGDPASGAANTSTLFSPTHIFSAPGSYTVTTIVSFPSGPNDTITTNVTTTAAPDLLLPDTIYECDGNSYNAQVQGSWSSYLWSDLSTASSLNITFSGQYSVIATDAAGCQVSDVLTAIFGDTTIVNVDTSFCEGTSIVFEGQTISASGTYSFLYPSATGCDSLIVLHAIAEEAPVVVLPADTTLCFGQEIYVTPLISGSWQTSMWSDGYLGLGRVINTEDTYVFSTTGNCGTAQDELTVLYDSCLSEIWFPNVFTPNGDWYNPVFKAEGVNILQFHIMIFNRWGQMVYEGFTFEDGWDGNFKGRECAEGVYFWVADFHLYRNSTEVEEQACGSVTLFR